MNAAFPEELRQQVAMKLDLTYGINEVTLLAGTSEDVVALAKFLVARGWAKQ